MPNFKSSKVILMYYPSFAGGKFVYNCLSLSRHCIITDPRFAMQDVSYKVFDNKFYQFKIDAVLSTLPPRHDLSRWRVYEFREFLVHGIDNHLYGELPVDELKSYEFNPILTPIIESDRYHGFVSHEHHVSLGFKSLWENAKVITLVNWNKFIRIAGAIKRSDSEDVELHLDYLRDFQTSLPFETFIFDVDNSMFNRNNCLRSIQSLYDGMGFDDFNPELIGRYYDEYMYLHN